MTVDPFANPSDTTEEILAATYRSLQTHGYADLTIEKIGEEIDASPSLIYHYFDDKDDLVLETLEHLLEAFEVTRIAEEVDDPREKLVRIADWAFRTETAAEGPSSYSMLFELRAQAVHSEAYREHFDRSDRVLTEFIAEIVEHGIEGGAFQACDPDAVADFIMVLSSGAILRRATDDHPDQWLASTRDELDRYLEQHVYRDPGTDA